MTEIGAKQVWTKPVNVPFLKKEIALGTVTVIAVAVIYAIIITYIRIAMIIEKHGGIVKTKDVMKQGVGALVTP